MENYEVLLRENHYQAKYRLHDLLLSGKIKLSDIPSPLRGKVSVYVGALRVSQHFGRRFVEDVEIIMEDALEIAANKNSYLYETELYDILDTLDLYLSVYDFGGERSVRECGHSLQNVVK